MTGGAPSNPSSIRPPRSPENRSPAALPSASRSLGARLLARIYEALPLGCPVCGADMRILASLTQPEPVHAILHHLGLPTRPPPLCPARGPPELELDFEAELDQTPTFDPADPEPIPDFDFDQSRAAESGAPTSDLAGATGPAFLEHTPRTPRPTRPCPWPATYVRVGDPQSLPASVSPHYLGTSRKTAFDLPILQRRALEDELAELERQWRAAEEIAAIADDLLLPEWIRELRPFRQKER